jgi:hydrogenase maturation protein HypF
MIERRHITIEGIVQGVGLRPFVYGLAMKNGLGGFVLNDTSGVTIELEGEPPALDNFLQSRRLWLSWNGLLAMSSGRKAS